MKDALTYAHDAGFFSFNVIGWKAEFERLIEAVRADALAELATVNDSLTVQDHIRGATKMVKRPQNCGTGFCSCIECVVKPDHIAHVRKMVPDHFADAGNMVPDHIAASGKVMLTTEQAQQIEEALSGWTGSLDERAVSKIDEALAIIRAARAQDLLTIEAAEKMGATGAEPTETERQMFEAWMKGHCWAVCGKWDGKQYVGTDAYDDLHPYVMHTRGLWAAWRDRAALAAPQPVSQEPVAWVKFQNGEITHAELSDGSGSDMDLSDWTPLYAAPVRTKDLTDDEIAKAVGSPLDEVYLADFRAVIAKFKEKNKC